MVGRYDEAMDLYKRVIVLATKDPFNLFVAKLGLVEVYSEMRRTKEAQTMASEILRMNPKFSRKEWCKQSLIKIRAIWRGTWRLFAKPDLRDLGGESLFPLIAHISSGNFFNR